MEISFGCVDCGATINQNSEMVNLQVGCHNYSPAVVCPNCGRCHWTNGDGVKNRGGQKTFIDRGGNRINKD